ncbi:MAG TPA: hypothetical protein VGI81_19120 [Tepidisphaeraceae bacterium]
MSVSRIPWAHRKSIGRWRAYWRTNLMVIFRIERLADEIARPVSFADAQRFRHVTVLVAWLTVLAWRGSLSIAHRERLFDELRDPGSHFGWWLQALVVASALFAAWLALLMMSGVGSYFFHPRGLPVIQQNRGIALSYYTCAPLALLWLPALCAGLAACLSTTDWVQDGPGKRWVNALVIAATGFGAAIVFSCWVGIVSLMARITRCGRGQTITMTVYLPCAWALCAAVAALIPAAVFYVSVVVLSFR